MAITTHNVGGSGLFDVLGTAFDALATLNTARGTTVPAPVLAFLAAEDLVTTTVANADEVSGVADAITAWQSAGSTLSGPIAAACQAILTSFIQADTQTVDAGDLKANLEYLIAQMQADDTVGGSYVTANAPSCSGTALPGGNAGDAVVLMDSVQPDGAAGQHVLAETIAFAVTSPQSTTSPAIAATSPAAVADRLDSAWPGGSGLAAATITVTDPASSLLTGGQFTADTLTGIPDGWIPAVATPGTTLLITTPCVQTLTVSGTPTTGTYVITWSDGSHTHATAPLAYNAAAADVQTALQAIPGLEQVTVSDGATTTPNYTHTVTFTGVGGAVANLATTLFGMGGSIAQAVVNAADSHSYSGRSLVLAGNASELTTLYQPLTGLLPDTTYFVHLRLLAHAVSNGVLAISVVQGIGGSVVQDSHANASNTPSKSVTLSGLSADTWTSQSLTFRLSPAMPGVVYLKLALSTAINNGGSAYLDDVAIAEGQQLYAGGPSVAAFQGRTASNVTDTWSYTVGNTWSTGSGTPPTPGGGFQTWFNRVFAMADLGLQLPTSVSGGTLLDDALIT